MKYPNKDYIEHLRRKYPPGTRLQLSCIVSPSFDLFSISHKNERIQIIFLFVGK